jgi:hypothetical protein
MFFLFKIYLISLRVNKLFLSHASHSCENVEEGNIVYVLLLLVSTCSSLSFKSYIFVILPLNSSLTFFPDYFFLLSPSIPKESNVSPSINGRLSIYSIWSLALVQGTKKFSMVLGPFSF